MKNKKGFVVSAVLYPLLVLFLAIIMGLLSMTDTRKRILDKMKLEITDNIFDDAACSCDTILAKLNYIIANGTGGSGGTNNSFSLNIKVYETSADLPFQSDLNNVAIIPFIKYSGEYIVSAKEPTNAKDGMIWIKLNHDNEVSVKANPLILPLGLCYQYSSGEWNPIIAYLYTSEGWQIFSDGYNNWKVLASLAGINYTSISSFSSLLENNTLMNKLVESYDAMKYLTLSKTLISDIKSFKYYKNSLVSKFLNSKAITEEEKYKAGLPFYLVEKGDLKLYGFKYISTSQSHTGYQSKGIDKYNIGVGNTHNGSSSAYYSITDKISFANHDNLYILNNFFTTYGSSNGHYGFGTSQGNSFLLANSISGQAQYSLVETKKDFDISKYTDDYYINYYLYTVGANNTNQIVRFEVIDIYLY